MAQKIDGVYTNREASSFGEPLPVIQKPYPSQGVQETNVPYAQPVQPIQPIAPVAFEPDDPIPDSAETTDKKHRPRFVDRLMRRNDEEK